MNETPQSLFHEDGTTSSAGKNTCLIKTLKEETKVVSVPDLPRDHWKTAVVVDAMYLVCRWSLHDDETFGAVARYYKTNLLVEVSYTSAVIGTVL